MNPVLLPQLIKGMEEAVIAQRLKQTGDFVQTGEPILEVETEKAIVEIESPFTGVIGRFDCQDGETVQVGTPVCWIRLDVQQSKPVESSVCSVEQQDIVLPFPAAEAIPVVQPLAMAAGADIAVSSSVYGNATIIPSEMPAQPAVLRSTRPIGFNPHVVTPFSDAKPGMAANYSVDQFSVSQPGNVGLSSLDSITAPKIGKTIPMSAQRRTIAKRMLQSVQTIPTSVLYRKADVTELVKMRLKINRFSKAKISLNEYVTKATVMVLASMPEINSTLKNDQIICYSDVNLGFAVDANGLLFVPVIHQAQNMDILDLAAQSKRLIDKAQQGKLSLEEMANPTFTISNTGIFGVEYTVPIILPPQSGILGVGATIDEPVEKDGKWETHKKLGLSYAFDHRVIDGALGAKFLQRLIDLLENPLELIWKE